MIKPKFTVIVPSYQGGQYLKQCVQSVLAQTYRDFELAVLDNCSNDGTAKWLAGLHDSRIKIYPSSTPLSIEDNWARAIEIPKNEFITFFGHDDLMDADYLEAMSTLIDREPEAGLYFAHFRYIDESGNMIRHCQTVPPHTTAAEFLQAILTSQVEVNGTGYVMRSKSYEAVGGIPHFQNLLYADHALWLMLIDRSYKVTTPQECFSYRLHTASMSAATGGQAYLQAITQFIEFFVRLDSKDPEFARVFEQYGPDFFAGLCNARYIDLLVHANKTNQWLEPQMLDEFASALSRIAPAKAGELRNSDSIRFHRFINGNRLLRLVYSAYLRAPWGKSQASALSRRLHKHYAALRRGRKPH